MSISSASLLYFVWVLSFSELKKKDQNLAGGMYFTYLPAGVRLEVSMINALALDTTADLLKQKQKDYSANRVISSQFFNLVTKSAVKTSSFKEENIKYTAVKTRVIQPGQIGT